MRIIPTENRATIKAYREGRSLEQYLTDMWQRRERENPREAKSVAAWPFRRAADQQQNVTRLPAKARRG